MALLIVIHTPEKSLSISDGAKDLTHPTKYNPLKIKPGKNSIKETVLN